VVPGRYFYKSLKWLKRIELLEVDRLGFWEATAGYHNIADPWREQRYVASGLTRQQTAAMIQHRDFRGRDLRSIDVAGHQLDQLDAHSALLRDARFQRCSLRQANFERANLSNAHFQGADLRNANFLDADVEGANFSGADLRGADFSGASFLGTTFVTLEDGKARLDATTQFDRAGIEQMAPEQTQFVLEHTNSD
jgi:uncharacterized protein YjbI with pentapeptide repeats